MVVLYVGRKGKISVPYPIGAKRRGDTNKMLWADPELELSEADANKLVKLDPHNFRLSTNPPKKRGRPKKE